MITPVGKWHYVAEYLGLNETIVVAFARCFTRGKSELDVYDVIDDIEEIMDTHTRDHVKAIKNVHNYLLNLGVSNVVRGPKGGAYFSSTPEEFADRFTPYFTGENYRGKAEDYAVDLDSLSHPLGYVHTPLSEYELELKDRRKNGYLLGDPPTMYHVYLSK